MVFLAVSAVAFVIGLNIFVYQSRQVSLCYLTINSEDIKPSFPGTICVYYDNHFHFSSHNHSGYCMLMVHIKIKQQADLSVQSAVKADTVGRSTVQNQAHILHSSTSKVPQVFPS